MKALQLQGLCALTSPRAGISQLFLLSLPLCLLHSPSIVLFQSSQQRWESWRVIAPATSVGEKLGTSLAGDFSPGAGPPLLMFVIGIRGKQR